MPEEVKEERWQRLMEHQQAISAARLAAKVGRTIEVIVDEVDDEGAVGRSKGDAPEVDGGVLILDGGQLDPGQIVEVEVTASDAYDLTARLAR